MISDPFARGAAERRSQIAQMVMEQGKVLVSDLVEIFNVTETSIRRDLTILEENKRLKRTHWGAIPIPGSFRTDSYAEKEKIHIQEKERIGAAAAGLIQPGNIILLDSGTTPLQVVRQIPPALRVGNVITLVTNSIPVAIEVLTWPSPNLNVLGGVYLPDYQATIGPQTLGQLRELRADIAFLGVDGLTISGGTTTANVLMAEVDRLMAEQARKVVLITDSSKIGRMGFVPVKPVSAFDLIITDANAPADFIEQARDLGIEVMLV